ncbi:hypothetical protein IT157_09185 [bacterium]|nr:hypothetical protein [bacterium]
MKSTHVVICAIVATNVCFAGSPSAPAPLPEDSVKIEQARYAILEIWRDAQVYFQDRGEWADSFELLDSLNYVELDSTLRADWTFSFHVSPSAAIRATQNYLAENARKDGMGVPHWVSYEIETGEWSGTGRTRSRDSTGALAMSERKLLVQEVQSTMYGLASASQVFYQDRGAISSVVQLVKSRYFVMPNSVKLNWQIRMYGMTPDSIVAVSTDWISDGPDHRIVYYPGEQRFAGYGVVDSCDIPKLIPYLENVKAKQ